MREKKPCMICGEMFDPPYSTSVCCSDACKRERKAAQAAEWRRQRPGYFERYWAAYSNKPRTQGLNMIYVGDNISVEAPKEPVVSGTLVPRMVQGAYVGGEAERMIEKLIGGNHEAR